MRKLAQYLCSLAVVLAMPAHAYIGPGAGVGAIAVVFGILASVLLAFLAIIWYPFKRLIKGWKASRKKSAEESADSE
jgi:hypothetical protein